MPTKPKHNYDIEKIAELQSDTDTTKGVSLRGAARQLGLPEIATQAWVNRNFKKIVKYIPY